ncbi:MAG TPA: bifunctional diaminohydroxyphosphoribosylaminopyrimidine deaminase/5-amino-6-(5-phosphoribosylamino)uracil reductase RibD [Candidatus Deferrimicrobium sp.]|nr:bifunctional diaminohydroxyphosphoribosylaminopyrimidine deaminase/5-amino-6-(5-phosphoribosylamino)uracil reductase RibD [Candidatus Deferrimicrobium sp.]
MAETTDETYMRRALHLAEKGRGWTSPNPMVGAVLVKNQQIIGEGYHRSAGTDHAEIVAIKKARGRATGATLYATLEPCCHTGRTGPCVEAIIEAGIKRVVYTVRDPDPRVSGRGARRLRGAGITVEKGLFKGEAVTLNESYFAYHRNKRPFIIVKTAQTLDGRIATMSGQSKWISSAQSLKMAHRLRADADAVVIGMGTLKNDNPALTVRLVKGKNPFRIVLSRSLDFPKTCRLVDDNTDGKTIIISHREAIASFLRTKRGRANTLLLWQVRLGRDGNLDLWEFVAQADKFGLRSLLVEGGSRVAASFLKAGLVDKYVAVIAPRILGSGVCAVDGLAVKSLEQAVTFDRYSFQRCGTDSLFIGYPKRVA